MPTLKCLARYRSRKGEFQSGQQFEASEAEARFYLADAPGSFEIVKGIATPAADKMVKEPEKAKGGETQPLASQPLASPPLASPPASPALAPSGRQAVTDPGAYTVTELKALDLTAAEWKLMLRAERRDKNRATAVTLIEEKIRELEA